MGVNDRVKVDLGGTWKIVFDLENVGLRRNWNGEHFPVDQAGPVQVPGIWNLSYPDVEGVAFYHTTFTVPASWDGKAVLLDFEGATYHCQAWVDGRFVGSHEGGYTPFRFDVSGFVQPGRESTLVVRVAALSKKMDVDGMNLYQAPLSKHSWYYVYGGLWGRVSLVGLPKLACQSITVDPDLHNERAQVDLCLNNRFEGPRQADLRLRVIDPRGNLVLEQAYRAAALPGMTHFLYTLPLPRPLAWSCDQPNLYRLEAQVIDEDGLQELETTRFGMRDFTVRAGQFFLNGQPVYIRGVLLQPNFPITLVTHPNREMMVREITLAKEAGFNLIRTHLQPPAAGFLDLADEMGMMVYAETNLGWIKDSPRLLEHGKRETQALIERDRNHPSVVIWGIYNENPTACAINGEALVRWARSIDPTRVVVDDSGGALAIDQDFGWIDRATVLPAYQTTRERIQDIHLYLGAPVPRAIYRWLQKLGTPQSSRVLVEEQLGSTAVMDEFDREYRYDTGQVFVSELGYGGMSDLDETVAGFGGREDLLDARQFVTLRDSLHAGFNQRGLERVFGSMRNLYQEAQRLQAIGNRQQIEAVLVNPRVSGYVITQYNDVSYEFHAGLLDLWRNPKQAYYASKRLNRPQVVVMHPDKPSGVPGENIEIELTLISSTPSPLAVRLNLTAIDAAQREVLAQEFEIELHQGIHPLQSLHVPLETPGALTITARLFTAQEILAECVETIYVAESVDWECLQAQVSCFGQTPTALQCCSVADEQRPAEIPHFLLAAQPETLSAEEWEELLYAVEHGETALIGALRPQDQQALDALRRYGLEVKLSFGIGSWLGCYHWIPQSSLFSGLPCGGLALEPYAEILPKYVMDELGGDVHAGSISNTQSRHGPLHMLWYSDIESVRLGEGMLVFCQYRVFNKLDHDAVAARMAFNLLEYAASLKPK